ncbi:MAG: formyltransferase family protein [Promethearchaeota archaeon]
MKPIHDPRTGRPLRVVGFFSGGASSLRELIKNQDRGNYAVVGSLTDKKNARALPVLEELLGHEKVVVNDYDDFLEEKRLPRKRLIRPDGSFDPEALATRGAFDERSAGLISRFEPDLLVFSGYMKIVTERLYGSHVILNVHPADLSILDGAGNRRYTGDDAVFDAIAAGERSVRSTIHVITGAVDGGPVVARSPPLQVPEFVPVGEGVVRVVATGEELSTRDFADGVQERLKVAGDLVVFQDVVDKVAGGRVGVERDGPQVTAVYLDGEKLDYNEGYSL